MLQEVVKPERKRQKPFQPAILPDSKFVMYDIAAASDLEQMKYLYWVKDKMKLYKAMFKSYTGT